ncbi:MAG: HipA N-terminal domain-containing protein [Candidatus Sabulitectum sp.]|nr:HipA N-terminal domain-containing protein [Candidatus Sabulitectum sp.]
MTDRPIEALAVFAEGRRTRKLAGILKRGTDASGAEGFQFTYEDNYLEWSRAVAVGPEMPLTERSFFSPLLFPSFRDRIPSKENPAYGEYCAATGIEVEENDPLILLVSIGKRGPSCFVFEPLIKDHFKAEDAAAFRKRLGLSLREFGRLFDFAPYTIQKIEAGKASGRDVLKRMEIYVKFPEVAWYEMNRNRALVHTRLWRKLSKEYKDSHGK